MPSETTKSPAPTLAAMRETISRAEALHAAVAAIYFADSADYGTALWSVVNHLDEKFVEMLENGLEGDAYRETEERVATARAELAARLASGGES